jgi:5,10-methylene-tetrahydrofolate dehydrogenase/methenyl tetrahydrofolate cyclohydrolase
MKLLDGKLVSQAVKDDLKTKTSQLREKGGKIPHLAAILVGNNGASEQNVCPNQVICSTYCFAVLCDRLVSLFRASTLPRDGMQPPGGELLTWPTSPSCF